MQWRFSMEESREEGRLEGWDQGYEHGLKQGLKQGLKEGLKEGLKQGNEHGRAEIFRKYYGKLQETAEGRKMTEEELLRNTADMFDMTLEDVLRFLGKDPSVQLQ